MSVPGDIRCTHHEEGNQGSLAEETEGHRRADDLLANQGEGEVACQYA